MSWLRSNADLAVMGVALGVTSLAYASGLFVMALALHPMGQHGWRPVEMIAVGGLSTRLDWPGLARRSLVESQEPPQRVELTFATSREPWRGGECHRQPTNARANEGDSARPQNKGMKLTKLSAAWLPEWTCRLMPALAGSDAGTASQLIPGVRRTS
jgi:hypothetical protein